MKQMSDSLNRILGLCLESKNIHSFILLSGSDEPRFIKERFFLCSGVRQQVITVQGESKACAIL